MPLPGADALGSTVALTVLVTITLTTVSYGLAELAGNYGGRTAHNFFAALLLLDGVAAMSIFAGAFSTVGTPVPPDGYVVYLVMAQALLVVAPYALGAMFMNLAPGSAVAGAIPISLTLGFLVAMDLGLVQLPGVARLAVAFLVVMFGPTVIGAASTRIRGILS